MLVPNDNAKCNLFKIAGMDVIDEIPEAVVLIFTVHTRSIQFF